MSALPRPDLPPGPHRELNDALHELHHRAGWPSLRSLAAHAACSHTTVSHAFSGPRLPAWGLLELLVEAMGGDLPHFHDLWLAASGQGEPSVSLAPRLAGRRSELAAVRRHLEEGKGLLVVSGEAGMGKTRLVGTAAAAAGARVHVAATSCLPLSTQVPLLPVADVLRSIHDVDGGEWLAAALATLPTFVPAALSRLLPEITHLATAPDPDDDWARQRLFTAISTTVTALAQVRPLAVVVEDLHWADAATLDLLEHVMARTMTIPMLGTWRLEDPDVPRSTTDWWSRVRRSHAVSELELGPLSEEETREQLALLSGVADDTAARVYARTLGHPLFSEQLLAHAHDVDHSLPGLLADLLDHRLIGLDGPAWQVTRALGVADRGLPHTVVAEATGLGPDLLGPALRELRDHRLLEDASGESSGGSSGGVVRLRHPLLAEAVRRRLVPGEAHETHRQLARAMSGVLHPEPAEVAAHWRAAGDDVAELPWRIDAARAADARRAGYAAAEHWTRVLQIWPPDAAECCDPPVRRPEAWFAAMEGYDVSGHPERAEELVQQATKESGAWPDLDRAELLRRGCDYRDQRSHLGAGMPMLDEAIEIYRRLPPSGGFRRALGHKALVLGYEGRSREAAELMAEARASLTDADGASALRSVLANSAWLDARMGRVGEALARMTEVVEMTPPEDDPLHELSVGMDHTDLLLMACHPPDEVERAARPGLVGSRTWGIESFERSVLLANVAIAWIRAGRIGRAAELLEPVVERGRSSNLWLLRVLMADVDVARGRREAARRRFDELLSHDGADLQFLAADLALFELWERRPDRALDVLEGLFGRPARPNIPGETGVALALAARAAADLAAVDPRHGTPAGRRRLAARVEGMHHNATYDPFGPDNPPADRYAAAHWAAELARLAGTATAADWLVAAGAWDRAGRPHPAAYCRWRAAQVALRTGQTDAAGKLLRRAARDANEHVPLLAAIRATRAG